MNIAHIVCVFPPYKGGIGNAAYNFAKVLSQSGNKVVVLTPRYKESDFKSDLFKIKRLKPLLKYGNAAFLPQLIFKLKKFDIVHLHYPFFGTAEVVWLVKLIYGKKIRLFIHYHMDVGGLPFYIKPLTIFSKLVFRSLIKQAEAVTCGSLDYIKNSKIKKVYKIYNEKFIEIPFGVDIDKFYPNKINKKENSIIFVGGLDSTHYFKGVELMLNALAAVKDLKWRLRIVGGGNLLSYYKKIADKFYINKKVIFLGGISDSELVKEYRKANFLILPAINKNEAFGLVLLEAMSSGIAVLASDLPGVRSVFTDHKEGLLFKVNNMDDLELKIRKLLADKQKTRKMGSAGRELAVKKYNWKQAGDKLNQLYTNYN
ncbi:hypothetical protein DRH27_05240 [Candidatus Falkowbacteria bacterium]|nr:MAG: hypothetical protein DRH27_05240 [Candidatus Falkowbacteria bacterium]